MVNTQYFDVILVVVIIIIYYFIFCQSRNGLSGKKRVRLVCEHLSTSHDSLERHMGLASHQRAETVELASTALSALTRKVRSVTVSEN